MKTKMKSIFSMTIFILASCSKAPECHYEGEHSIQANAGCFTVQNNTLLIIEGINGSFQLPGGGKRSGEVAQCTAERETWEETGFTVKANNIVTTFDNGFALFNCEIKQDPLKSHGVRHWGLEVKSIHWLGPEEFANKKWRFPEQAKIIKKLLEDSHVEPVGKRSKNASKPVQSAK